MTRLAAILLLILAALSPASADTIGPKGDKGCSVLPFSPTPQVPSPPVSLGLECDWAFDARTGNWWGPKQSNDWGIARRQSAIDALQSLKDSTTTARDQALGAASAAAASASSTAGAAALVTSANFTPRFSTVAAMKAATIPASVSAMEVDALVAGTPCPMRYVASNTSTGVYGEESLSPIGSRFAQPVYSRPLRACEFKAVADASAPDGGAAFTATANNTRTLTVSSTEGMQLGMNVAPINWASLGITNVPIGTKITAIGAGSITVSNNIAAGAGLKLVAYWLLDATNVTGTDNRAALQAMIDYAASNNIPIAELRIDEGKYRVDGTLRLGGANFNSKRLMGGSRPSYPGVAGGVTIYCTAADRPCVNFGGQREGLLSGVALIGPNRNFLLYSQWFNRNISANPTDWLSPELTKSGSSPGGLQRYSPLAAVAIDGWRGSCGAAPYAGTYDDAASSGVRIEKALISGFAIGVTGPNCADTQADFITVDDVICDGCIYGFSIGNTQSRAPRFVDFKIGGCFSAVTGTAFGGRTGKFGGPVENIALDGCYQAFEFSTLAYSGPLHFRHIYSEGGVRIGKAVCTTVACPDVTIEDSDFQLDAGLTGQIPARLIETGASHNVILRNTTIVSPPRITTLAHSTGGGQSMALTMDGGAVLGPGYTGLGGPGGSAALQAAINATGGINIGTAALNTALLNQVYVRAPYRASYYPSAAGSIGGHTHAESIVFDASGSLNRAPLTLVARRFLDNNGREWKLQRPAPLLLDLSSVWNAISVTLVNDQLTIVYPGVAYANGGVWALQPGYVLYHDPTGINFVITSVTASGGNWIVVAQQQNGLSVTPGTNTFASNTIGAATLQSGYMIVVPTGFALPRQVNFGRFTAGSTSVANVSRGDGVGSDLASWLATGDILFGPDVDNALDPFPISKRNTIASVTAANPAALTLSANANATGDFPIYPIPIR